MRISFHTIYRRRYFPVSAGWLRGNWISPSKMFFQCISGILNGGKFTDYHGNVWPMSGALPTTNRGGLIL